jgi:AsmA protein
MKRLRPFLIVAAGAAVAVAAAIPWRVSEAIHRLEIAPQIGRIAGLKVMDAGEARFTLLPVPRLEVTGLRLVDADGRSRLETVRVRARARMLALLGGRFDVTEISLFAPRLTLAEGRTALPVVDALLGSGSREGPHLLLDRIAVIDGSVVEREGDTFTETVSSLDVLATRMDSKGAVDVEGRMIWRGQPVAVTAKGFDLKALSGAPSARLRASATTPLGSVDFDGTVLPGAAWQAEGTLRLASPAVERLSTWLSVALPVPLSGQLTLAAKSTVRADGVALDNARLTLAAGVLEGAVSVKRGDGYPALRGTLASDRLDLSALIDDVPDLRADDGSWSRDALDVSVLPRGDVDLRISAGRIVFGQTTVGSAAVSVLSRNGRTDIALAKAEIFRGDLRGRLSLSPSPRGVDVKLGGSLERADAALLLQGLSATRRIGGSVHANLQGEASGNSVYALMRSMDGKAAVTVRQGDLVGINLPEVLRRVEKRPLLAALDMRGGRTPFDVVNIAVKATRGLVDVNEASLQSSAAKVTLTGQIGMPERQFLLTGLAQLSDPSADVAALPFELSGTFDDPLVVPDFRAPIRRVLSTPAKAEPRPEAFAPPPP